MPVKSLGDWDLKADAPGHLEATFSRFDVVDHDGDVTLPSAFTDGQAVPMVWSHDWDKPVGKGVIRVKRDRAVFAGQFNLNTSWGRDAYESVKDMADLQEYSYGYRPLDAEPGTLDGQPVRFLKAVQVFEVSPVLVGAGIGTGTDRLKQADPADPVDTFLGQAERVLADLGDFRDRTRAITALRLEAGRNPCSKSQRAALTALLEALTAVRGDCDHLLRATGPAPPGVELDAIAERFLRRHGGN